MARVAAPPTIGVRALDGVDVRHGPVEVVADLADAVDDRPEDLQVDRLTVHQVGVVARHHRVDLGAELRDRGGLGQRVHEVALVVHGATGHRYDGPDVGAEPVGGRVGGVDVAARCCDGGAGLGEMLLGELGLGQSQVCLGGVRLVLGVQERAGEHGEDDSGGDHHECEHRDDPPAPTTATWPPVVVPHVLRRRLLSLFSQVHGTSKQGEP